ncbi:hypothetical protein [Planctomyces sp. SH-PL62]|uniref:hypothetical protein n=1 Tax=Planctomyces sp. SH-PL62 TaxID=1636152 RepID=UPI0018D37018|nr:hypothetical protein [Planctomyces sp. SH-PL62]
MSPPHPTQPQPLLQAPVVQAQLDQPSPPIRGWSASLAPAYLGVLAWFPLLDTLGGIGPSGASVLSRYPSAVLALIACYGLLYLPLALQGLQTRRRLTVVASEAFGVDGAEWITGVLYGLFAAVWGAIAIAYSVRLTLMGLAAWGLVNQDSLLSTSLGGVPLEGPLALTALAFWTFIIASANGLGLMNVIAAMMRVYSPFAALVLILAAAWCGLQSPASVSPGAASVASAGGATLLEPRIFQFVFGAFAFAGLMAVEWGGAVRDRRDVRLGGWIGILAPGAATLLAALVLSATGGAGSIRLAIADGLGGSTGPRIAGALLLLFGLSSLAPACYASALFTQRLRGHWPVLRGWTGVWLAGLLFFLPGATGLAWRLEAIATIAGAFFASAGGVLAADVLRSRGRWTGLRSGWHAPGAGAWVLGVSVGLAPLAGEWLDAAWLRSVQPAALFAYVVSGVAYLVASRVGTSLASVEPVPTAVTEAAS